MKQEEVNFADEKEKTSGNLTQVNWRASLVQQTLNKQHNTWRPGWYNRFFGESCKRNENKSVARALLAVVGMPEQPGQH